MFRHTVIKTRAHYIFCTKITQVARWVWPENLTQHLSVEVCGGVPKMGIQSCELSAPLLRGRLREGRLVHILVTAEKNLLVYSVSQQQSFLKSSSFLLYNSTKHSTNKYSNFKIKTFGQSDFVLIGIFCKT